MNVVDRARKFAEKAHKTQVRKYTGEPYFVHLDEVSKLCARHGLSKRACAAAYLHDVIEDQPVTYREIVSEFGKDVADIVRDLTDATRRAITPSDSTSWLIVIAFSQRSQRRLSATFGHKATSTE